MTAIKPWAQGYALPSYLKDENSLARHAKTTPWLPRRTMTPVPKGLKLGGYAQPKYLREEPIGGQAQGTPWLPRGTAMQNRTSTEMGFDYTEADVLSQGLGDNSLEGSKPVVSAADPIKAYGQRISGIIMDEFNKVPHGQREKALRELLGKIDPSLFSAVMKQQKQLKDQGVAPKAALQQALATSFSAGFTRELMRLGKEKKLRSSGQLALAAWSSVQDFNDQDNYTGLSGFWSTVESVLGKVGSTACDVVSNPAASIAAGAAGAYTSGATGASAAMTGVQVAQAACSTSSNTGSSYMPPPQASPSWMLPAAIGGGALILILILK